MWSYRCRRCGVHLYDASCVITSHGDLIGSTDAAQRECDPEGTVWYICCDHPPKWLQLEVIRASWTKGKVICPKCGGRLGSFDFLKSMKCFCKGYVVPSIHIARNRVDCMHVSLSPSLSSDTTIIHHRAKQPSMTFKETNATENSTLRFWDLNQSLVNDDISISDICKEVGCDITLLDDESQANENNNKMDVKIQHRSRVHSLENNKLRVGHLQKFQSKFLSAASVDSNNSAVFSENFISNPTLETAESVNQTTCHAPKVEYGVSIESESEVTSQQIRCHRRQSSLGEDGSKSQRHLEDDSLRHACSLGGLTNRFDVLAPSGGVLCRSVQKKSSRSSSGASLSLCSNSRYVPTQCPERFTCSVCLDLFFNPHFLLPCRHVFCETCLRRLAKTQPIKTLCPLCREVITKCVLEFELATQIRENYPEQHQTRKVVEKDILKKACPLPKASIGRLDLLQRHLNNIIPISHQHGPTSLTYPLHLIMKIIVYTSAVALLFCLFCLGILLFSKMFDFTLMLLGMFLVYACYITKCILAKFFQLVFNTEQQLADITIQAETANRTVLLFMLGYVIYRVQRFLIRGR